MPFYGTNPHGAGSHTDLTRTIWLAAPVFSSAEGSPDLAIRGSSANGYDKGPAWAFDGSSTESVATWLYMPADWDGNAVTVALYWAPSDTGTGTVQWQVLLGLVSSGDQIDEGFAELDSHSQAGAGTADALQVAPTTSMTPLSSGLTRVHVRRDGGAAGDTYDATDAWFVGLLISYTATQ